MILKSLTIFYKYLWWFFSLIEVKLLVCCLLALLNKQILFLLNLQTRKLL